ncbi:2-dehydro-3-deoxygalactonokinase [Lysobacter cavernae]|uniref:2-dehydro-3-deoxygalactonokinase n=1 Tax=Lysobacter cavernae TaxID=1685901 RepID=A0ABV7RPI7_9GAMM
MIAVDWGTTRLRAYRLDADGAVLERRDGGEGALSCAGRHAQALAALIAGWDDGAIVLCGMVGARGGWREVPYVDCPADAVQLAAALLPLQDEDLPDRKLWLVPGMADHTRSVPDVMRGEETQVAGLLDTLDAGEHTVCLPGTHSKWVRVESGRITSIATAMTGELFALLRTHSTLGRLMESAQHDRFDAAAFDDGLARSAQPGGFSHHLFGVRSLGLFGRWPDEALPSYLSGLLIGHEVRALAASSSAPVHLLGGDALVDAYARALAALGIASIRHAETLGATGMHRLVRLRGIA